MIDRIVFNYTTDHPDYLTGNICPKMREFDKGPELYHFSDDTVSNPLYPLRVKLYPNNRVVIAGSIHKYSNKIDYCNDTNFNINEALVTLKEVCEKLKIDMAICDPKITSIEFGVNIKIGVPIIEFLKSVGKYKFHAFSYSKTKSGTTKKWGKEIRMTDYDLKFYDKSYLINKELKNLKYPEENLLRFEVAINHHLKRYLNFDSLNGLVKNINDIPNNMINILNELSFKPTFDYKTLSNEDILACEAFNSDEFYYNIKNLSRGSKENMKRRHKELIKNYAIKSYSTTVHVRLKRKVLFLAHT